MLTGTGDSVSAMLLGIDLWSQNPAGLAKLPSSKADQAKELSDADLAGIRAAVDAWQTDRKMIPLKLMVNLLVGTGMWPGGDAGTSME